LLFFVARFCSDSELSSQHLKMMMFTRAMI
jgi:hypothetical protein